MNKILIATSNAHKVEEIRQILGDIPVFSMKEAGISCEIEENGTTFEENAMIKARALKPYWDGIVVADDSGLEIDALDGQPGVHSARFMGEETSYDIKNKKIMEMLDGLPDEKRSARFVCALACIRKDNSSFTLRGTVEGIIARESAGENGFGYDPIFYLPDRGCTSAQLSPEEKNAISHRGRAFMELKKILGD